MNIPKATATLTAVLRSSRLEHWPGAQEATRLGIEALKLTEELQRLPGSSEVFKLPGQTEEPPEQREGKENNG